MAMSLIELLIHFTLWTRLIFCSPTTVDNRRTLSNKAGSDATNAALSVKTLSTVPVPEDFKVEPQTTQATRYPQEACYLNTVHALEEVALDDFGGPMPRFTFSSQTYPGLIITAIPPDNSEMMERRVVVWGLFLAVRHMAMQKAFQPTIFQLKWSNQDVGRIQYSSRGLISRPNGQQQRQQTSETDKISILERPGVSKDSDDQPIAKSPQGVSALDDDDHLLIHFRYFGHPPPRIGKADVLLTVLAALTQAAVPLAAADARTAFTAAVSVTGLHCTFILLSPAAAAGTSGGGGGEGNEVPKLRMADLIYALAAAADFYVANRVYTQLEMKLSVKGVDVGTGVFWWNRDANP
ncbi:MAG: hypothetical protein LQ346_008572 [Caloplaca aetnensis]|nr:MAG: hypothetical protein LQ346_008572 [Caloplaca aetnensis]